MSTKCLANESLESHIERFSFILVASENSSQLRQQKEQIKRYGKK